MHGCISINSAVSSVACYYEMR